MNEDFPQNPRREYDLISGKNRNTLQPLLSAQTGFARVENIMACIFGIYGSEE
jgi:hypothetical protein